MTRRAAATAAGVLLSLPLIAARQQVPPVPPQATFRAGIDIVQLDISVLDRDRKPVRGLTMADFTVLEDGKPRPIAGFAEVDLPTRVAAPEAAWMRDAVPDVVSNQAPEEGRLVVIVMDRSIPFGQPSFAAKKIATAAVNQLGPTDLGALVSTSAGIPQNLTSDRARLLRAINASEVSAQISDEATENEAASLAGRLTPLMDGRCYCGLCVLETITHIADAVRGVAHRRKSLLFIGSDLTIQSSDVECGHRLKEAREKMMIALDRAGVTIHSIDPRGLETLGGSAATRGWNPSILTQNLARQEALRVLPSRTGGRTVLNNNEPERDVPEIFHESDSYYLIGFRPSVAPTDETFHKISVKVNRRGVSVATSRGYVAAAPEPPPSGTANTIPPSARAALTGLLPSTAFPLNLAVATFASPESDRAMVALTVGVGSIAGSDAAPQAHEHLEVIATAYDRVGRPVTTGRQTVDFERPSPGSSPPRAIDVLSRLDLRPGEYEIRVAVTGTDQAKAASVYTYVTVPAFTAEPMSLSNIVLGLIPGGSAVPKGFLEPFLPVVPTAQREFAKGERAVGFIRVYQGTTRHEPIVPITLRARVVDSHDRTQVDESFTMSEIRFGETRAGDFIFNVPMAGLPSGEYALNIEARTQARVAGRLVRFRIK